MAQKKQRSRLQVVHKVERLNVKPVPPEDGAAWNAAQQAPSDADNWAQPVARLKVGELPKEAINLNVEGRQVLNPVHGFGQLWCKTYRVRLGGPPLTACSVIAEWKQHYGAFWPKGNRFHASVTGIAPGDVAVLNLKLAGLVTLSTGVLVVYADDTSFCFMTPQGHMYGGIITFSAEEQDGAVVAQVETLTRASDPFFELTNRIGVGHKIEDTFWHQTLRNLAAHFSVRGSVEQQNTLLDPAVQWSGVTNIWHNAAIRTVLYTVAAPLRWLRVRHLSARE